MKQVANLTFVVEIFPEKGIFILRGANGMPLSLQDSSVGVADWIDLQIAELHDRIEQFEKDKSIVDNV